VVALSNFVGGDRPPDPRDLLKLDHHVEGQWVVFTLAGDLDLFTVGILRGNVVPSALPDGRVHVALDISGLTFCDSTGIGTFIGMSSALSALGGQLVLLRTPEHLMRRLLITGIQTLVPMRDTLDAARGPGDG
jgi:anti-sigma B factor antagonist